jgi:hypothetical protein
MVRGRCTIAYRYRVRRRAAHPCRKAPYARFRLTDRKRTLSFIAFWATAPGVRFNFFATAVPDNFAFASSLSVRTSSFDHATIRRLGFDFALAMIALGKSTHNNAGASRDVNEDNPALPLEKDEH